MGIRKLVKNFFVLSREYSEEPISIRAARYPDGKVRIQGAYIWCAGLRTGTTWKDLPIVNVSEDGSEI